MAYDDALFQLGMDLTRSSTAQKEDLFETTPAIRMAGTGMPVERDASRLSGQRFTIDLFGTRQLGDTSRLSRTLARCMADAGVVVESVHFDRKKGGNSIAGMAMLFGGHMAFSLFPAARYAAFDVSGCPDVAPSSLLIALAKAFEAGEAVIGKSRRHDPALVASRRQPAVGVGAAKKARTYTRMPGAKAA